MSEPNTRKIAQKRFFSTCPWYNGSASQKRDQNVSFFQGFRYGMVEYIPYRTFISSIEIYDSEDIVDSEDKCMVRPTSSTVK